MRGEMGHYTFQSVGINFQWVPPIPLSSFHLWFRLLKFRLFKQKTRRIPGKSAWLTLYGKDGGGFPRAAQVS